ncbi:MAG: porin [Amylibacter sp.]|nr:porin [Amylibacter sp.]
MKNTLLTTTAIALTGIAGAANAVEISAGALSMNISGYYTTVVAITSVSTGATLAASDYDGLDIITNAEIWFKPSLTLDNGIKIGVDVQLEGNTNGDQIDEVYMTVTGDFGKVIIGSENSVGYKMTVAAPDVSMVYAVSSSLTAFVPYSSATAGADLFRGTLGSTYTENARNNDAQRISYFSPRFSGLQLGVSYARDAGQGNGAVNNNAVTTDFIDIAANYSGSFGGMDLNASARWGIASAPAAGTDPEIWGVGLSVGSNGFTLGGSYTEQDGTALQDGRAYDVGVSYANGPTSYSLTYFNGENIDNEGALGAKESLETIVLAVKYKVAPNFKVGAFIANTQFEEVATPADNVEGTVVGVSASFSF